MRKVLFTGCTFSKKRIQELKSQGFLIKPAGMDLSENGLIKALKDCDAFIPGGDEITTKKVIESSPNLKIIAFLGAGYEKYIDVKTATKRGIAVTNTPGANAYTVAEHTVALILDAVKQITYLNQVTKKGKWTKRQAWNLQGKTLGILGMGAVGKQVARILHKGFGMEILYCSRKSKPRINTTLNAHKVGLEQLMEESDVISIHASFTGETKGMIRRKELAIMKKTGVLVNTSRAEIVDGHALYEILKSCKILAAAFDNYYQEPPAKEDKYKLLTLPDNKFIITPHTAYSSKEAILAMEEMIIESLTDFFNGKEPKYLVNPGYKKTKE